ncbi:MAG: condensation domain-containing protein [Gammaproteobacteria bacterium]
MKNVQDIYPATPMQELMLLHTLAQRSRDTLLTQFVFAIEGSVDAEALRGAWQAVVERHPMLRTAFVSQKVDRPLQVVRQQVTVPFETIDLRDQADQQDALDQLCREDRSAGIDPTRAPLTRFFLVRLAADQWRLIWTSHHLLMDRWCLAEIFRDLDTAYEALLRGHQPNLSTAPAYRQYVDWLSQQDDEHAAQFWRQYLAGYTATSKLASTRAAAATPQAHKFSLAPESCAALEDAARRFAVSKGTLVQAALALTLGEANHCNDVVFGIAAAARPPAVPNVERIVGSFVNNLPVRSRLDGQLPLARWLKSMQQAAFDRSDYEYVSPLTIAAQSELPEGQALFDTLLVWLAPAGDRLPLDMTPLSDEMATAYPLTLSVEERADAITLFLHQRAADPEHAAQVLDRLRHFVLAIAAAQVDSTLHSLLPDDMPAIDSAPVAAATIAPVTDTTEQDTAGRESIPEALMMQLVAHQFAQALELDSVDPDQDFFELGGNSLRAAQLHANLCRGTRKNVPLLALFKAPTVNGIARTLAQADWPTRPGMVLPLRSGGRGAPLICVASPEVNTLGYFVLSRRLAPHTEVAVLQAPPLSDTPEPMDPDIIEPMARDYVTALREYQPAGPYKLLGMCGGAHLALAMSRQLQAQGETVAFFGVVNTWSLYSVSWVYYVHRARRVLAYYRRRLRALFGGAAAPAATEPSPTQPTAIGPANEDVGLGSPWIRDVGFAHKNPGIDKLPLHAHVLRIERQQYWRIRDEALGWSQFFDSASVHRLPGRFHDNLMREPYVEDLADALQPLLDADAPVSAQSAATPPTKATPELLS